METISTSMPLTGIKQRADQSVFQLLSFLLQYPEAEELQCEELEEAITALPYSEVKELLQPFLAYLKGKSATELAEEYVLTFDFNSKTSMYLTYSKMGEERERGKWLVELKQLYRDAGFEMTEEELSDYLPLILEFLSVAPEEKAKEMFSTFQPAIEHLLEELEKAQKPYSSIIQAVLSAGRQIFQEGSARQ